MPSIEELFLSAHNRSSLSFKTREKCNLCAYFTLSYRSALRLFLKMLVLRDDFDRVNLLNLNPIIRE